MHFFASPTTQSVLGEGSSLDLVMAQGCKAAFTSPEFPEAQLNTLYRSVKISNSNYLV